MEKIKDPTPGKHCEGGPISEAMIEAGVMAYRRRLRLGASMEASDRLKVKAIFAAMLSASRAT